MTETRGVHINVLQWQTLIHIDNDATHIGHDLTHIPISHHLTQIHIGLDLTHIHSSRSGGNTMKQCLSLAIF